MNILIMGAGITLVLLSLFLIWKIMTTKKQLGTVSDELNFFKSEKEFYDEAMILLSSDYRILFSNQAAKELFSLNQDNEIHGISKKVDLKIDNDLAKDFFEVLKELNTTNDDSFKIKNAV